MARFEVQTGFTYGWDNSWTDTDENGVETPTTFETRAEALAEIDDTISSIRDAIALGFMTPSDMSSRNNYRVVPCVEG